MFVGAAGLEALGSDKLGGIQSPIRGTAPGAADFAALLSIAQAWDLDTAATDSSVRTEASRAVSVAGHVRTTTLHFTDGSSDIEVSVVDDDRRQDPTLAFQATVPLPLNRVNALSDLEPEVGIDPRRYSDKTPARWFAAKSAGSASRNDMPAAITPSHRAEISDLAQALQANPVGELVDILI